MRNRRREISFILRPSGAVAGNITERATHCNRIASQGGGRIYCRRIKTMSTNDITNGNPCIGFIESSSIARGVEAVDAMMKMADVELLMTAAIPRGKYLIMVGGRVADVEAALRAGLNRAAETVLDHFIIQNVHPELPPAIKGRVKVDR